MARLNVEDEIEADSRFHLLTSLVGGDAEKALGKLTRFWRLAQKYWGDEKALIPEKMFLGLGFGPILEADLAEKRPEGIYARGAEGRFDWYLQKVRASKAAAEKRRQDCDANSGNAIPDVRNRDSGSPEQKVRTSENVIPDIPLTPALTPAPAPAPALTPAPALSPGREREKEITRDNRDDGHAEHAHRNAGARTRVKGEVAALVAPEAATPPPAPARQQRAPPSPTTPAGQVWEAYREAYLRRYGAEPVRNAKVNAQCGQLVARLGADDAPKVVAFYLTHGDAFYQRTMHALGPCLQNAEGLRTQMLAGHRVTQTEARQLDESQARLQVFKDVHAKLKREGVL